MLKKFLSFIGKLRFNRTEFVYFFSLPMSTESNTGEELRKETLNFITKNLKNKSIEFSDFFTDYNNGKTYFIFGSAKQNPFFIPLFYQIYAYTKLEKIENFNYTYETLIFKETTILKFKVKCYGKKQ